MEGRIKGEIYGAIASGVVLALGLVLVWLFLHTILEVLLLFSLSTIAAIALTPIVNWLEARKISRGLAALVVLAALFALAIGLFEMVSPWMREDINHLAANLPRYVQDLMARLKDAASGYPAIERELNDPNLGDRLLPSLEPFLGRIGHYSLSVVTVFIGSLVCITVTAYMLAIPRPLLRGLLQAVPEAHRDAFDLGLVRGCDMIVRWVWANAIIGMVEAICASICLSLIGVPGALVWGAVTLFAEMVPQLGAYLMAIPPTIVALAADPTKAVYVIVFYICLQQIVNHLLAPIIRSRTMRIHPVSEIFTVLALTLAFGLVGAVIADPVLGFVKAFYDSFYGDRHAGSDLDDRVESVLKRNLPDDA